MTIFYFVRHGETETNRQRRFNGATVDSPLTKEGIEATKRLAENLKDVPFDLVVSSTQVRAQTTAEILLDHHNHLDLSALTTDSRLIELNLGEWEGVEIDSVSDHPEIDHYMQRPDLFDAESIGAETYDSLLARTNEVLEELKQQYPNGTILIVSHGIVLRTLLKTLQGIPLAKTREGAPFANASVTIAHTEGNELVFDQWGQTF
ncbi:histidine phosphatase family protein [Candidatus Enterococcus ferrettii]|uniref:Histidine phosphatase family protein n=1 Tax=Candidatus Enterococcus ferrettii TaxID=2815324 RepID=A0ABV0EXN0_9ENTE|nr:histidine phosphatase family protein [Enterococcus sp. 665A]MBO1342437.1 histidine phosphatase family protein [Enterococcus sp. 665A]